MNDQTDLELLERIRKAYPDHNLSDYVVNTDGLVNIAIMSQEHVFRFVRNEYSI